ncbi:MAG: hypothetical protein V4739_11660 [Pseudomonadota bacterium]
MSTAVADPRAERLANLWSRLSAQHVTLGAGCGCMTGGVSVSLEDFELDIADYLWAEGERLGQTEVVAWLLQPGPVEQQVKPVMTLLTRLEEGEADEAVADWLLTRLARTLDSFAKLHGPSSI